MHELDQIPAQPDGQVEKFEHAHQHREAFAHRVGAKKSPRGHSERAQKNRRGAGSWSVARKNPRYKRIVGNAAPPVKASSPPSPVPFFKLRLVLRAERPVKAFAVLFVEFPPGQNGTLSIEPLALVLQGWLHGKSSDAISPDTQRKSYRTGGKQFIARR